VITILQKRGLFFQGDSEVTQDILRYAGEGGIGKVALVDKEINAIFSDFLIRLKFDKKKYLPEFCYYYMRSFYFQYLIEIHKKGLGNNTNIFPNIINEFPIPDIDLGLQQNIVKEIVQSKENINKIRTEILNLRSEIKLLIN
nr:hypothetical protein [Globicatella sanguinis]